MVKKIIGFAVLDKEEERVVCTQPGDDSYIWQKGWPWLLCLSHWPPQKTHVGSWTGTSLFLMTPKKRSLGLLEGIRHWRRRANSQLAQEKVLSIINCCGLVAQSCLTLCDLVDSSLPSSSVHGILQARRLEWVAIPFSRISSQPRGLNQDLP